jgi:hypothetical protein
MTGHLGKASPRTRARLTGVVYLPFFATAVLGAVVAPGISGPGAAGNGAATANNIMAHQTSFRLGWAPDLLWLLIKGVNSQRWTGQAA